MKKVLPNTPKTKRYLDKLQKIYLVGYWAHCGVRDHYFSGKYDKYNVPLVWDYYDANGFCDEWHLIPLTQTTTGMVICWSFVKPTAKFIAESINTSERVKEMYGKS